MMLAAFAIKYSTLGYLIYLTMGAYTVAFVLGGLSLLFTKDKTKTCPAYILANMFFAAGFCLATATFVYRWTETGTTPFQNLFEVFLSLMVLIWPISVISKRFFGIRGQTLDMLIGALLCVMPGFIRSADISPLRPAMQTTLFVPHVGFYMLGTILMAKATVQAIGVLITGNSCRDKLLHYERSTYGLVSIAFPPMTTGLVLGCIWAKLAWGDFWSWDPKEQWSLATWLAFIGYFHLRFVFGGRRHPRTCAAAAIICMVLILITLLWANLSSIFAGIHSYA